MTSQTWTLSELYVECSFDGMAWSSSESNNNQMETPPPSDSGSESPRPVLANLPLPPDQPLRISTSFYPSAQHFSLSSPDSILLSSDSVFFFVHSTHLLNLSCNGFNFNLPKKPDINGRNEAITVLQDSAEVLDILLRSIYSIPCRQPSVPFDVIERAAEALETYGVSLKHFTYPGMPFFELALASAPNSLIDLYAFAAHNDLSELAIAISSQMLAFDLSSLTDEQAIRIGSVYLKRLFFLHMGRSYALKNLLLAPVPFHQPNKECDSTQQTKLNRGWLMATAQISWEARPDMSPAVLEQIFGSLRPSVNCKLCEQALGGHVRLLVNEWSKIKLTV